jgi:Tol biopolymer transport system component
MPSMRMLSLSLVAALLVLACGGNDLTVPPNEAAATITTTTTGTEPDVDGYAVQVDGNFAQPITANGSVQISSLTPGTHTVLLSGVAANCTVADNPRSVEITSGQPAVVTFAVTCSAPGPQPGSSILFASKRTGKFDIFSMNGDGSNQTNLTQAAGNNLRSAWSRDGKKIAFETDRAGANDIFVMNADGTGQKSLTGGIGFNSEPAWSPDGQRLAFISDRNGNFQVFVISADATGVASLTDTQEGTDSPAWSPDGRHIAFSGGTRIVTMNPDGTMQTPLTTPAINEDDEFAQWSPDGGKIAFVRHANDPSESFVVNLWVMNADGSNAKALTSYPLGPGPDVFVDGFSWSPDGSRIAYAVSNDIHVVNADGSGDINLTNGSALGEYQPHWSPDGSKILFSALVGDAPDLFIMNADGGQPTNLTNNPAFDADGEWRP